MNSLQTVYCQLSSELSGVSMKMKPDCRTDLQSSRSLGNKVSTFLGLFLDEVESFLTSGCISGNHDVLRKRGSLHHVQLAGSGQQAFLSFTINTYLVRKLSWTLRTCFAINGLTVF